MVHTNLRVDTSLVPFLSSSRVTSSYKASCYHVNDSSNFSRFLLWLNGSLSLNELLRLIGLLRCESGSWI